LREHWGRLPVGAPPDGGRTSAATRGVTRTYRAGGRGRSGRRETRASCAGVHGEGPSARQASPPEGTLATGPRLGWPGVKDERDPTAGETESGATAAGRRCAWFATKTSVAEELFFPVVCLMALLVRAQPTMSHSAYIASTCLACRNVAALCRKRHMQQCSYAEPPHRAGIDLKKGTNSSPIPISGVWRLSGICGPDPHRGPLCGRRALISKRSKPINSES